MTELDHFRSKVRKILSNFPSIANTDGLANEIANAAETCFINHEIPILPPLVPLPPPPPIAVAHIDGHAIHEANKMGDVINIETVCGAQVSIAPEKLPTYDFERPVSCPMCLKFLGG